ncbi:MAG: hypothetical protein NC517_00555 [Firmicutes bacterium]|nr:hypothetical protein [Bacillota bacterium]
MDALMSVLIKMSLRGIIIILVILLIRFLMKRLRIGHKYILGLWAMTFLFFIVPWKMSLSVGFWNNADIPEQMRMISEFGSAADERNNIAEPLDISDVGIADSIMVGAPAIIDKSTTGTVTAAPVESKEQNIAGMSELGDNSPAKFEAGSVIEVIWLAGLSTLFGHMIYSYFALKRKLRLSVLYEDNIWWAENIDIPMVFGLIRSKIYLPTSMEFEDLSYVIAHEKMHIKRKDSLFKMLVYVICLIHWFNPFVWIAYFLFGSDLEKACDEEVIRTLSREDRKKYAYALLYIAAENGSRKKRVFVAPICFDEGNVKSRIRNIMKYKYTLPGIGSVVVIVIVALSVMFATESEDSNTEENVKTEESEEGSEESVDEGHEENAGTDVLTGEETEKLPVFYVEDLNVLQIGESFSLEDYYITSRYTFSNHYYIDENGVLWGAGENEFGQLGTGTYGSEEYYEEPVKIAENVISVDASWNNYFCIYLTEGGELYGIGSNHAEVLLGEESEAQVYSDYDFQKVTEPVLLMTDVAYARAGRACIVALKNDQTAYWWGQYAPLTHTYANISYPKSNDNYWKLEEDISNPVKMFAAKPMKILERCKYITTGTFTGAAISESGELYTWGFNVFGQCGTTVTEDDFVRTPVKVMDGVKMVWSDRIAFGDSISRYSEFERWETDYKDNTFVLKEDNSLLAVGLDLGDKEKITQVNGDILETQTHRYNDDFVPVQVIEYSISNNLTVLSELEFGMSIEEVEQILNSADMRTFRVSDERVYSEGYEVCLAAKYNQYHCYFDSQDKLARITLQEGGSRDGRFALEMSLSDLEKVVEETLTKIESDYTWDTWEIWSYQDQKQQIQYEFSMYKGRVIAVDEIMISENSGQ